MALLERSTIEADHGELVGRDPRTLTPADFAEADVELRPVFKSIRAKCLDCCAGDQSEVRKCVSVRCPLWPMRMGRFPKALRAALREDETQTNGESDV